MLSLPHADGGWAAAHKVGLAHTVTGGKAHLITDRAEMQRLFEAYTQRFAPSQSKEAQLKTIAGSIGDVALWEVTIEKLTGKAKSKAFFSGMTK